MRILEWRDVTLEHEAGAISGGIIRLRRAHSKTKRGRVLVLTGDLLDVITSRTARRVLACPFVFHCDGRPLGDLRKPWPCSTTCVARPCANMVGPASPSASPRPSPGSLDDPQQALRLGPHKV